MASRNLAARAGRWSAQHRRIAIFGWLGSVVVAFLLLAGVSTTYLADEDVGNGDSRRANQILADAGFNERAGEQVLIQSRDGRLTIGDPEFRATTETVVRRLKRFPTVVDVTSPLDREGASQISRDRRSVLVDFDIRGDTDLAQKRVGPIQAAVAEIDAASPRLRVEQFGDASAGKALDKAFEDDFRKAEVLSIPITLVVLVIAFGALVAAGLPLLLGLSAVLITLGLLAPISRLIPLDEAVASVVLLVGLAVGVDYSLFYIRRERDERAAGRDPETALERAAATSGRAVLVSGITVMVAMAGMYVTGNSTFSSFGTGTILVVAVAVVGSVTVLPALLSKLGDRIDRGHVPLIGRLHRGGSESGFWATVVAGVLRHPWLSATAATAVLVIMATPALRLHTADSGVQGLPRDLEVMKTYDRIQKAFPGGPIPAVVVVRAPDVTRLEVTAAIRAMRDRAVATGQFNDPLTVTNSPDRTVAQVAIAVTGDGTDDTSNRAIRTLREDVIPQTIGRLPGVDAPVTGLTAGSLDFNDQMRERAPWVFLFVLSLAFVLLMVTFRSIVIPIKAIILNLLSVFAAYGVTVWIFQDGRFESLIGYTSIGGITSWLPLFLFVILFGLSMDYHVFILSRVREGFDAGMTTADAVAHGIRSTAGVVTSAAAVMVGVFGVFATLSIIDFKEMGIGLAAAVLIDATIVRAVLLPASMRLLGDWNWYLPRWLEWLPRVAPDEPAPEPLPATASARPAAAPPARLAMEVLERDGAVCLAVRGELDLQSAPEFRARLARLDDRAPTVIVDLREVSFLDSTGIGELLAAHQRIRREGRRLIVVRSERTQIAQVLHVTATEQRLETADSPQSAGFSET